MDAIAPTHFRWVVQCEGKLREMSRNRWPGRKLNESGRTWEKQGSMQGGQRMGATSWKSKGIQEEDMAAKE